MIEQLFGSKTRVQLLRFFLAYPHKRFYAQEVTSATKSDAANVLRELRNLHRLGILQQQAHGKRHYYNMNLASPHYHGLQMLLAVPKTTSPFLPVKKNLLLQYQSLITDRGWYHQRFDGSPMFLFHVGEAEITKEQRKPVGTEANIRVCFFDGGKADWYLDEEDIQRGSRVVMRLGVKNPQLSKGMLKAWKKDEGEFADFFWKELPNMHLSSLSVEALLGLWNHYYSLGLRRFTSSAIIDHFALGTDQQLRQLLRKEVFGAVSGKASESMVTEIFSIATAPVHQSFINQAEIELLKIGLGLSKESVAMYANRYYWLKNNYYTANVLSEKHFQKELSVWKRGGKNLRHELRALEQTPTQSRKKKAQLFRKYRFSAQLRSLITISEDFSWWQDERKKATYQDIHAGCVLLKEIGRRTGYTVEQLKFCVGSEISGILQHKRPAKQELQIRAKGCVVLVTREGYVVETGRNMEKIKKLMFGDQKLDDVQDVRGLSASLGRAVGTVKVVKSVTEMDKVQHGDILVAVMTRPDYVPAMRRAAAIVTNEGGVTSHAAIVSRELGIPCIIGTKIATEVFHDGDLVEVNANHGWIRKVQS